MLARPASWTSSKSTAHTLRGLLVKDRYWRWPERKLAGNAIPFFMRVLGLTFNDAMHQITGS